MDRPCAVWFQANDNDQRLADIAAYGHARHVCVIDRPFAREHPGDHRCGCGLTMPKQATDND